MKRSTLLSAISLAGLALATSAHAQSLLFDCGGDYVSGSPNLVLPGNTTTGTTRTWQYSDTTAISPSSGYNGTVFYGALQTDRTGTAPGPINFSQAQVTNVSGGDRIKLVAPGSSGNTTTMQGLIFFKKADFLNYTSSSISFNATSTSTIAVTEYGGTTGGIRLAVLEGSTWYLSNSIQSAAGNFTISNLATQNFASWDPTGAPLNPTPGTFGTAGSSFSNIQGVGLYFDITRENNLAQFPIDSFEISAIPEPTTWALLAIGGTAFVIFRRRRRY